MLTFLKKLARLGQEKVDTSTEVKTLLDEISIESFKDEPNNWRPKKLSSLESYNQFTKKPDEFKIEMIFELMTRIKTRQKDKEAFSHRYVWRNLLSQLIKSKLDIPLEVMQLIVTLLSKWNRNHMRDFATKPFLSKIEKLQKKDLLSDEFVMSLLDIRIRVNEEWEDLVAEERTYNSRINQIHRAHFQKEGVAIDYDDFGKSVNHFLIKVPTSEAKDWKNLFQAFAKSTTGSRPSKTWKNQMSILIEKLGTNKVAAASLGFTQVATFLYKEALKNRHHKVLGLNSETFLKNLIWTSHLINNAELNNQIEELGLVCFKKLKDVGQIGKKIGNACIIAFSLLPFESGIQKLIKIRSKVNYPSTKKLVEKSIQEVATREGKTADEIEEMGTSEMGLNESHQREVSLGDYTAIVTIHGFQEVSLVWKNPKGKIQKSVPAAIKTDFANEIKLLRKQPKAIKENLLAQRHRIERFFLKQRTWVYQDWFKYYIEHPLTGYLGKSLIWHFTKVDQKATAIYHNGQWTNPHGEPVDWIDEQTEVRLWHPIGYSTEHISNWRNWLNANEIQQAFKQAFREIYIVTDAETTTSTYSNRFAAHIIRQFQFNALCQARGWKYSLQGTWDSHNTPYIHLPDWDLTAEFWVDANHEGETSDSGIFNYVYTDQVRFRRNSEQVRMEEVPPLVFSEMMRDVDMFVGVASIGNDPSWLDTGNERFSNYWRAYSTGALSQNSKTRKEVLEKLIPRLKIADQCSFTDKFLIVDGHIRTYKIHLGSGNILMEPNDQYLCIVADRKWNKSSDKVFLPFEGDQLLSIILSKAFLLAEDRTITDLTIIRQINHK